MSCTELIFLLLLITACDWGNRIKQRARAGSRFTADATGQNDVLRCQRERIKQSTQWYLLDILVLLATHFSCYANSPINMLLGNKALCKSELGNILRRTRGTSVSI